jgi:hypothetical protein
LTTGPPSIFIKACWTPSRMSLNPDRPARTLSTASMNTMPAQASSMSPLAARISFETPTGVPLRSSLNCVRRTSVSHSPTARQLDLDPVSDHGSALRRSLHWIASLNRLGIPVNHGPIRAPCPQVGPLAIPSRERQVLIPSFLSFAHFPPKTGKLRRGKIVRINLDCGKLSR